MTFLLILVYSLLFNFSQCLGSSHNDVKYDITYHNKCLSSDLMLRQFLKINLKQCVKECATRRACESLNYRRQHLLCELYLEGDGVFVPNSVKTASCVFIKKSSIYFQTPSTCDCTYMETCDLDSQTCIQQDCYKISVHNGRVKGNMQNIGSQIEVSCYFHTGSNIQPTHTSATCDNSGKWSHIPCANVCPALSLYQAFPSTSLRHAGTEVKFACNEGSIEMANKNNTVCLITSDGTLKWSYEPHCVVVTCSPNSELQYYTSKYENVALNKTVIPNESKISTQKESKASYMVDGILNTNHPYCAHAVTNDQTYTVDLGESYTIHALYILNRGDCCAERLNNVSILIGESMDTLKLYVYHGPEIGVDCVFVFKYPCQGRYVKIENTNQYVLQICEFEVYASPSP